MTYLIIGSSRFMYTGKLRALVATFRKEIETVFFHLTCMSWVKCKGEQC